MPIDVQDLLIYRSALNYEELMDLHLGALYESCATKMKFCGAGLYGGRSLNCFHIRLKFRLLDVIEIKFSGAIIFYNHSFILEARSLKDLTAWWHRISVASSSSWAIFYIFHFRNPKCPNRFWVNFTKCPTSIQTHAWHSAFGLIIRHVNIRVGSGRTLKRV